VLNRALSLCCECTYPLEVLVVSAFRCPLLTTKHFVTKQKLLYYGDEEGIVTCAGNMHRLMAVRGHLLELGDVYCLA
jgi:hypothetical protein